jgi:CPA2 family monovalent cation:H+ antiporter-2
MDTLGAHAAAVPDLRDVFVLLVAAIVVVIAVTRLRASPVLGYFVAGIGIGPHGFGLLRVEEDIRLLAELGVVFLLFMIGLELSLERLKTMRRFVLGLGGAQILVTGAAIAIVARLLGLAGPSAITIGLALALSSTAVVVQILVERGEIASRAGRATFSVLLAQDIAVVPLLMFVSLIGEPGGSLLANIALALVKAAAAILLILAAGRYLCRWPFRWVAATRSSELFVALTLLVVLGTAWLTHMAGLSMALGAFLAGLLVAETEYRHQVEADIRPFKGLLLGLFFISVGMIIDLRLVATQFELILLATLALVTVKAIIASGLARAFGLPSDIAVRVGLLLGEGGEFVFVIVGAGVISGAIEREIGQFVAVVTGLSILLTPLLAFLGGRLGSAMERRRAGADLAPTAEEIAEMGGHVIIAGFGRVGRTVAELLAAQQVPFIAVDLDPHHVRSARAKGYSVYFGDATRREVLHNLGAERAAALIVTLDHPESARRSVTAARRSWPDLKLFVRARDATHVPELRELGAADVIPETLESSLTLARHALDAIGAPREAARRLDEQAGAASAASNGRQLT